ncbi:MAG: hypothetical protein KIS63_05755 [Caldilineales bacterium]|nr:hypothetical protein [Caldilineales bacterium]
MPLIDDLGSGAIIDTAPLAWPTSRPCQKAWPRADHCHLQRRLKAAGRAAGGPHRWRQALIAAPQAPPLTTPCAWTRSPWRRCKLPCWPIWQDGAAELPVTADDRHDPVAWKPAPAWADALTRAGLAAERRPGQSAVGGGFALQQTLPTTS